MLARNNVVCVKRYNEEIKDLNFIVNPDGTTGMSRRKLADLLGGKHHSYVLQILTKIKNGGARKGKEPLPLELQPFAYKDFNGSKQLPDILCEAILLTEAYAGNKDARNALRVFSSIGIRTWIKEQFRYEKTETNVHGQYLETFHDLMNTLRERDCKPIHFSTVNGGINEICGVENGKRSDMDLRTKSLMLACQGLANVKLLDRPQDTGLKAAKTTLIAASQAVHSLNCGDYEQLAS